MIKERYKEEYEEGSDLLWPSDKEDKITRQFYKDLSNLSKNINYSKKKKLQLFEQVVRIIKGKGWDKLIFIMDFIKKNKILTLMAVIAVLSFVLEKVGIIHP